MPATTKIRDRVYSILAERGIARATDFTADGISHSYLYDLTDQGLIDRVGRGLFSLPGHVWSENRSLAEISAYIPQCVICLLSALQFHGIGTQMPPAVWIAMPNHSHAPQSPPTSIQMVCMNDRSLGMGVETHVIEGVSVKIFSAAKTIVDCFRYRVGKDVCLEALRDALERNIVQPDELYALAQENRILKVMLPYMEAML